MTHYHIRWSNSKLDWQAFASEKDTKTSAEQLLRPGETYTIEQFGDDCERCKAAAKVGKRSASHT